MKRTIAILLALAVLCVGIAGCTALGRKNSATRIITKNAVEITELSEKILETGQVPEDAFFTGVEHIEYIEPDWLAFYTGGWGTVPAEAYCGFYYEKDDLPRGFQGQEMELTEDGSGWSWSREADGTGREAVDYYTERCQYGWYYFEIYFGEH